MFLVQKGMWWLMKSWWKCIKVFLDHPNIKKGLKTTKHIFCLSSDIKYVQINRFAVENIQFQIIVIVSLFCFCESILEQDTEPSFLPEPPLHWHIWSNFKCIPVCLLEGNKIQIRTLFKMKIQFSVSVFWLSEKFLNSFPELLWTSFALHVLEFVQDYDRLLTQAAVSKS